MNKTSLSFPLATLPQVRREIAGQLLRIRNARWWFLLAVLLLSAGSFATVMVPQLLGRIVDLVAQNQPATELWTTGAMLGAVAITGGTLSASGFYLVVRISERVIANLREDMVGTALGLPTHQVEDAGTGDLVSRSTDDIAELSSAVTETIPILTSSFFTIVATTIALLTLDWQFLLIPVLVAPVYYLASRHYLSKAPKRYARERAAMAERARRVLEAIRGRTTVRAYSMENKMHTQIKNSSWTVVTRGIRARTTMLILNTWMLCAEFLMLATALLIGYHLVTTGDMTVGTVTGALLMIIRLRGPLNMFMRVLDTVQSGYASLARIVGVVVDPQHRYPIAVPAHPRDGWNYATSASATATTGPYATSTFTSTPARPSPWSAPPVQAKPPWQPYSPDSVSPTKAKYLSTASPSPTSPIPNASHALPWSARKSTPSPEPCAKTSPWPNHMPPTPNCSPP